MSVTEQQRRDLYDKVSEQLGADIATLLMEVTVPANVEYATRGDLQESRADVLDRIGTFEQRMTEGLGSLDRRITEGLSFLDRRITDLDRRTTEGFAAVDRRITDLDRRMAEGFAAIDRRIEETRSLLVWRVIPVLSTIMAALIGLSTYFGSLLG